MESQRTLAAQSGKSVAFTATQDLTSKYTPHDSLARRPDIGCPLMQLGS